MPMGYISEYLIAFIGLDFLPAQKVYGYEIEIFRNTIYIETWSNSLPVKTPIITRVARTLIVQNIKKYSS